MAAAAKSLPTTEQSSAIVPPSATHRATEMLDLMMRLSDILGNETQCLGEGRIGDIAPLQLEKGRLSVLYEKSIKEMSDTGISVGSVPAPLRAQLVAASNRLTRAVTENERALRIGRAATLRIMDMVIESARLRQRPSMRYTARSKPMAEAAALSVAVNRRL